MDVFATDESESGGTNSGDVLVVDAFEGGFHAARKFSIEAQGALPSLRHFQVLVHDGSSCRGSQVGGQVLGAKQRGVVGDDVVHVSVEVDVGILGIGVDVLILHAVGVTHGRNNPHERNTAGVEARTTTEDVLTIAGEVPVEAQTGREVHAGLGHVGGGEAAQGVIAVGDGVVHAFCIVPAFSKLLVVVILGDGRIVRQFGTQTKSEFETLAEGHFVLQVE